MPGRHEQPGLSLIGKILMIYFSALFGVEVVMPWVLVLLGQPETNPGDANTKAVLTNLVIALWAYLLGRNEGGRQAEDTISKLVDTAKKAQDVIAAAVPPTNVVQLDPGQAAQAPGADDQENRP